MRVPFVALLLLSSIAGAETIDVELLWRSSEIDGGVVMNDVSVIVPTDTGVYLAQLKMMGLDVMRIDAQGTSSEVVEIVGEAPGHVNAPGSVDVSRDGSTLAVTASIQGRTAVRSPVMPPFAKTETVEPYFDDPGMATGSGQRIVDGAVITFTSQQPAGDVDTRVTRLVRHDTATGEAIVLHEDRRPATSGRDSPMLWSWDATDAGVVFLNDDFHSGSIVAYEADGTPRFRIELPVEIRHLSDEVIENNRKQYEMLRGQIPASALPTVVETFPAIQVLAARGLDGRVHVVSSAGVDRPRETIDRIEWWVIDATSGDVIGREAIELPGGQWQFTAITWFGDRIYVAGSDMAGDGVPEVVCLRRLG